MRQKSKLENKRFGRWLVIKNVESRKGRSCWLCFCNPEFGGCGNTKIVEGSVLVRGYSKSCGCLASEIWSKNLSDRNKTEWMRKISSETNKGKTLSKETKRKMSEIAKERFRNSEDHPMWNPNLTDKQRQDRRKYPEYYKWRETVYERDNYTCQICGSNKSGTLNAHHLESYRANPKLRTILDNGITLCETCHKNFHHQYGYGNNTKQQFEEFKEK